MRTSSAGLSCFPCFIGTFESSISAPNPPVLAASHTAAPMPAAPRSERECIRPVRIAASAASIPVLSSLNNGFAGFISFANPARNIVSLPSSSVSPIRIILSPGFLNGFVRGLSVTSSPTTATTTAGTTPSSEVERPPPKRITPMSSHTSLTPLVIRFNLA